MNTRRLSVLPVCVFLLTFTGAPVFADEADLAPFRDLLERSYFPENDETRQLLSDAVHAPAYPAVETPFKIHRQRTDGRLVQFEVRRAVRDWYLIFRNQRGLEPRETYPLWGRGSWIIKKDLLTGDFVQAKIFLQDDENTFVRLFPDGANRCRLDIHLYGRQLGDDVIVPVAFDTLMTESFARIAFLTRHSVDWEILFPDPGRQVYRNVEMLVRNSARHDSSVSEVDDAAISGSGLNVLIESGLPLGAGALTADGTPLQPGRTGLNCSGYVKWITDGIYSAWLGSLGAHYTEIDALRMPTTRNNRNPWSQSRSAAGDEDREGLGLLLRDPEFGLDWNRNLAGLAEGARMGRTLETSELTALEPGDLTGIPWRPDMGYSLADLPSALYQLASKDPGTVYLAAVNSRFLPQGADTLPLHQYWHVAILAPWFDDSPANGGRFHVAVMDTGDVTESLLPLAGNASRFETRIIDRAVRYARLGLDDERNPLIPDVLVHLIRMEVPPNFIPVPLPGYQNH